MSENELMIRVQDVKKQYRLGQIGGGTLRSDLQSWWARKRGKEDPNSLIGTDQRLIGTTFMALNGVSFTVKKGEAVGIIGSNGAGKSTLLKLLTHVTAPSAGDIDLYGRVASMLEVGTGFHPEMTGRENVYLNGAILGMTHAEIDAKMDEIIAFSEVGDFIDTPVKRYSSGMYVKLAFSVAAHLDSEIMIMDEVLDKGKVIFDGDVDEGIATYLSTRWQTSDFVDYTNHKRDNWFKRDNIRIQNIHVQVQSVEAIERTQPVRIHYVLKANELAENIGLRFEVRDEVGTPLATSSMFGLTLQPGINEFTAEYDLSVLTVGKYSNYFTVITSYGGGTYGVEDWVPGIQFQLVDTFATYYEGWNRRAWGPICLPEPAVTLGAEE